MMTSFPYCSCIRMAAGGRGPYSMTKASETRSEAGTEVCYDLMAVNADATGKCTRYDLRKIEFDVKPSCRGAVQSVKFNDMMMSPSFTSYPDQNALVFKITKSIPGKGPLLGTYADLSKKTNKVCIMLRSGDCASSSSFIVGGPVFFSPNDECCVPGAAPTPSPIPSPVGIPIPSPVGIPPAGFPYCACTRSVPARTYTLGAAEQRSKNSWCWSVQANRVSSSSRCVNYDLRKIEFNTDPKCRGSIDHFTWGGKEVAASYTPYPKSNKLAFKVTGSSNQPLAKFADVEGKTTQLCIYMRPDAPCPTLTDLCGGSTCAAAAFSQDNRCCPVQVV